MPANKAVFINKTVKLGGNTDKFVPNGFTRVLFFLGFRLLKIFSAAAKPSATDKIHGGK